MTKNFQSGRDDEETFGVSGKTKNLRSVPNDGETFSREDGETFGVAGEKVSSVRNCIKQKDDNQ